MMKRNYSSNGFKCRMFPVFPFLVLYMMYMKRWVFKLQIIPMQDHGLCVEAALRIEAYESMNVLSVACSSLKSEIVACKK